MSELNFEITPGTFQIVNNGHVVAEMDNQDSIYIINYGLQAGFGGIIDHWENGEIVGLVFSFGDGSLCYYYAYDERLRSYLRSRFLEHKDKLEGTQGMRFWS
jgi:hypothetical protein